MKRSSKNFARYVPLILLAAVLLIAAALSLYISRKSGSEGKRAEFSFSVKDRDVRVVPWQNEAGETFVFVPSFCAVNDLSLASDENGTLTIDGVTYKNSDPLSGIAAGEKYACTASFGGSTRSLNVTFLESSGVHTVFVDTKTGSMARVDGKKGNSEDASVALFDDAGNLLFSDGAASIKGRGNGSWNNPKKPYLLTFGEKVSLLGMTPSKKYVLLSNNADQTNLRNKIAYDIAGEVFEEWTPACEFAELYLNGEYNGLYLLSEKIEGTDEKLGSDDGGKLKFIAQITFGEDEVPTPKGNDEFLSDENQVVMIEYKADGVTDEDVENTVSLMEKRIAGKESGNVRLDLYSWACKYATDEFTENGDADIRSSWFYCREEDGELVIYAGPIWDYDFTMGRNLSLNGNPSTFTARREYRMKNQYTPYYARLNEDPEFCGLVRSIWASSYRPAIARYMEGYDALCERVEKTSERNYVRWGTMLEGIRTNNRSTVVSAEGISDWIGKRLAFLDSAWIDGVDYRMVQIESDDSACFYYFSVVKGEKLPENEVAAYLDAGAGFADLKTGEDFDISSDPVERDMFLVRKSAGGGFSLRSLIPSKTFLLYAAIIFAAVVLLIAFIVTDRRRNRGK